MCSSGVVKQNKLYCILLSLVLNPSFLIGLKWMDNVSFRSRHKSSVQRADIEKKALILGAGYVSSPAVEYLLRDKTVQVTVVSQFGEDLSNIGTNCPEAECVLMDIHRSHTDLDRLVAESDVVVRWGGWEFWVVEGLRRYFVVRKGICDVRDSIFY